MRNTQLHCPECGSDAMIVSAVTSYYLNSGDLYCHSVKIQDYNAEVCCLDCGWKGLRDETKRIVPTNGS